MISQLWAAVISSISRLFLFTISEQRGASWCGISFRATYIAIRYLREILIR
jgi:hypothetical protein